MPSKWLMQKYPALAHEDGTPDERAYHGLFDPFYRGAFDAGLQVRVLHARQLVDPTGERPGTSPEETAERHPLLVVPGLYLADDTTLSWLKDYATAGGHLILGPRTAYADHEARARTDVQPAHLAEAAGVWYDEFSNLTGEIPVLPYTEAGLDLPPTSAATRWVDGLQPEGAEVLARYDHPHFGQWPAATTHAVGQGRVTYVGTVPNQDLAAALLTWACPQPAANWQNLPDTVTSTTATAPDGRRVRFLHNWSWNAATVRVPVQLTDVLQGTTVSVDDEIRLEPWDVRVLVEKIAE